MVQDLSLPQLNSPFSDPQFKIELSETVISFQPGTTLPSFDITIHNDTGRFSSFQLTLTAAGIDTDADITWYRLAPAVSSKIPPGSQTRFQAEIIDVPPIPGGLVDTLNLVVLVEAVELGLQERQDLRLIVRGTPGRALKLSLPQPVLQLRPGKSAEIQVDAINPNPRAIDVTLQLKGLAADWLTQCGKQFLSLGPNQKARIAFPCQVPPPTETRAGDYEITIEAIRATVPVPPVHATLTIQSSGFFSAGSHPQQQQVPSQPARWLNPQVATVTYQLTCENHSNQTLVTSVKLQDEQHDELKPQRQPRWRWPWPRSPLTQPLQSEAPVDPEIQPGNDATRVQAISTDGSRTLTLEPANVQSQPGETVTQTLTVTQRLPWLGRRRQQVLRTEAYYVTDPCSCSLEFRNHHQRLDLQILPLIPVWVQGLGVLLLLALLSLPQLLERPGHTRPVNSVRFSGTGNEVVSAADDGRILRWQVDGRRLNYAGRLANQDKAVRVVRYRPVNNNQIAAGFENGAIWVQDLLVQQSAQFQFNPADRVFDLAYQPDARLLFSGHGSGAILAWQAQQALLKPQPVQQYQVDYAVQALGIVGDQSQYLAIAGRYNRLRLLNLVGPNAGTFNTLAVAAGGQDNYITSLATADFRATLLAIATDRGQISIWDLARCGQELDRCEAIDNWLGHGGNAIKAIALSANGCYLVSAGADGRVKSWALNDQAQRRSRTAEGQTVLKVRQAINSIDVVLDHDRLRVVSGGNDHRVRLNTLKLKTRTNPNCS